MLQKEVAVVGALEACWENVVVVDDWCAVAFIVLKVILYSTPVVARAARAASSREKIAGG